jgi:GNAT superfamily N-acetyltransferase
MTPDSNSPSVQLRFAGETDAADAAMLIRAMDAHYRPGEVLLPAAEYAARISAVLREREGTRFALARAVGGQPLGIACVAVIRPGRDLAGLVYLKDLFVIEEARGRGIGRRLLRFLAHFALDSGIGRLDFTADRSNVDAQRLYESLGARVQEKICYSVPGERLRDLAGRGQD